MAHSIIWDLENSSKYEIPVVQKFAKKGLRKVRNFGDDALLVLPFCILIFQFELDDVINRNKHLPIKQE